MGYYAHSEQSDFYILRENFVDALESLHKEYPEYGKEDDLPELMTEFGLTVEVDKHGNIVEMYYEYEKFHSDEIEAMFNVLAPFVEAGSYIAFRGEDDTTWAYYFNGSESKEYQGKTIYPGMPMDGPRKRKQQASKHEQGGHHVL